MRTPAGKYGYVSDCKEFSPISDTPWHSRSYIHNCDVPQCLKRKAKAIAKLL